MIESKIRAVASTGGWRLTITRATIDPATPFWQQRVGIYNYLQSTKERSFSCVTLGGARRKRKRLLRKVYREQQRYEKHRDIAYREDQ